MKQTRLIKMLVGGAVCAVALATAFAQDESSTTTTTTTGAAGVTTSSSTRTSRGAGTITAYTPGSDYISFRTETSAAPVKYYYTKKTVLVDADGKPVEWSLLRPDLPVTLRLREGWRSNGCFPSSLTKPFATYEKRETTTTTTTTP